MKTFDLKLNDEVSIRSAYTGLQIRGGVGRVTKVCKRWVEVTSPAYRIPVRFRTSGPLCGIRIIGGLAESLNDRIVPYPG